MTDNFPKFLLLLLTVLAAVIPATWAQEGEKESERLYRVVLDAGFYSDKLSAGERLGRQGTPAARKYVLKLIEDDNYWNREAGLKGLSFFADQEAAETILYLWTTDPMTESTSAEIISGEQTRYLPLLEALYPEAEDSVRGNIINLAGSWGTPETDRFLSGRFHDRKDSLRSAAFKVWLSAGPEKKRPGVLDMINDPDLRPQALDWVAEFGTERDLPILREPLVRKEKTLYGPACRGINRLAGPQEAEAVMFEMITSPDTESLYPALSAFDRPVSERLMKKLAGWVFEGPYQEIRILAAIRLTAYSDNRIIPALIHARKETFVPARADGWDIFAAHITLGLSALFRHLNEKQREKEFNKRQTSLNSHLRRLSGTRLTSSEDWTEWAISRGFTIDGQSMITRLFAPEEEIREQTFNDAIRLMGETPRSFYRKNPALLDMSQTELSLELARRLTEGKYIKPEKP